MAMPAALARYHRQMSRAPSRRRRSIVVRRAARRAGAAAYKEKHRLLAVGAAAALGYAAGHGMSLPSVPALGPALTYGLGAWLGAKMLKSKALSHAATGLLAVGAYEFARTHAAGGGGVTSVAGYDQSIDISGND